MNANTLELVTPEDKTYTSPMSGYYPSSFSFEDDQEGENPIGWDVYEPDDCGYVQVISQQGNHKGVIELRKYWGLDRIDMRKNLPGNATKGTIEFWLYKNTDSGIDATIIELQGTKGGSVNLVIENADLYRGYYESRTLIASNVFKGGEWHHMRCDFDISKGWHLLLDNIQYGGNYEYSFINAPKSIDYFYVRSHYSGGNSDYAAYIDALGCSWLDNYDIGDNIYEGLLVSYTLTADVETVEYSLNSGSRISIGGQNTIPVPSNGSHTIKVYVTSSSGTTYSSELRQFSISISFGDPWANFNIPEEFDPNSVDLIMIVGIMMAGLVGIVVVFRITRRSMKNYQVKERMNKRQQFKNTINSLDVEPKTSWKDMAEPEIPIKASQSSNLMTYCPVCGADRDKDSIFCQVCGHKF